MGVITGKEEILTVLSLAFRSDEDYVGKTDKLSGEDADFIQLKRECR
jgi:hypothetical protein